MKKKKPLAPLTDLCKMTFGPHRGDQMQKVPALYLLGLIGTDELKEHPEVAAYIERARRQLKAEADKELAHRRFNGD